jgi:hypothetical protein
MGQSLKNVSDATIPDFIVLDVKIVKVVARVYFSLQQQLKKLASLLTLDAIVGKVNRRDKVVLLQ